MNSKRILFLAILTIVTTLGGSGFCFDQEDIALHGFLSQGCMKSFSNNYFGNTKDGSFKFNEIKY